MNGLRTCLAARLPCMRQAGYFFAPLAQLVEHLTFNQRVGSSSLLRGTMHEWRSWYTHRNKAPASQDMWVRIPPRVLFNVLERKKQQWMF